MCIFTDGENSCSHQFLNWCQQQSTGLFHINGFDSLLLTKTKNTTPMGVVSFVWSRVRESNPPSLLGKQKFYR